MPGARGSGPAVLEVDGREIVVTNPDKVYFPDRGITKLDLCRYYATVGDAVLRGVRERPTFVVRAPGGVTGRPFFQHRVPDGAPVWVETVRVTYPSGRHAVACCPVDVAHVVWLATLGGIELHPWPVRRTDPDRPDELRVDLDPMPGVPWSRVVEVAAVVRDVLEDHGLSGYPKTSGSTGVHVHVRIAPRWSFPEVRRAALALARAVARAHPEGATAEWWKEQRGDRVFVDFNQNARDRTLAAAYCVRVRPDARVACPVTWTELADVDPAGLTLTSVPDRLARIGDPAATIDDVAHDLTPLLERAARDEAAGLGDAPWPPNFPRQPGEPRRVAPSRRARD